MSAKLNIKSVFRLYPYLFTLKLNVGVPLNAAAQYVLYEYNSMSGSTGYLSKLEVQSGPKKADDRLVLKVMSEDGRSELEISTIRSLNPGVDFCVEDKGCRYFEELYRRASGN